MVLEAVGPVDYLQQQPSKHMTPNSIILICKMVKLVLMVSAFASTSTDTTEHILLC